MKVDRIYELETGDFIDLSAIISISSVTRFDPGNFAQFSVKCQFSKEPLSISNILTNYTEGDIDKIRNDLIRQWKKWVENK